MFNFVSELSSTVSRKMLTFHRRLHRPAFIVLALLVTTAIAYMDVNAFLLNDAVDFSKFSHVFTFFVLNNFSNIYILYGLFGLIIFVLLTTAFFHFQQQTILDDFSQLNASLENRLRRHVWRRSSEAAMGSSSEAEVGQIWQKYTALNRKVIELCSTIQQYSTFWSPCLSVYFCGQITLQCYLIIISIFATALPFIQRALAMYTFCENSLCIFLLIDQCAKMVRLNGRLETANRRFYLLFQRFHNAGFSSVFLLLKVQCYYFLLQIIQIIEFLADPTVSKTWPPFAVQYGSVRQLSHYF